jgi:hypothetical protein
MPLSQLCWPNRKYPTTTTNWEWTAYIPRAVESPILIEALLRQYRKIKLLVGKSGRRGSNPTSGLGTFIQCRICCDMLPIASTNWSGLVFRTQAREARLEIDRA